jgi:hypothetical protein
MYLREDEQTWPGWTSLFLKYLDSTDPHWWVTPLLSSSLLSSDFLYQSYYFYLQESFKLCLYNCSKFILNRSLDDTDIPMRSSLSLTTLCKMHIKSCAILGWSLLLSTGTHSYGFKRVLCSLLLSYVWLCSLLLILTLSMIMMDCTLSFCMEKVTFKLEIMPKIDFSILQKCRWH